MIKRQSVVEARPIIPLYYRVLWCLNFCNTHDKDFLKIKFFFTGVKSNCGINIITSYNALYSLLCYKLLFSLKC